MKIIVGLLCTVSFVLPYTDIPIIGILSQEAYKVQKLFPDVKYHSYIAASYVKLLESAGARIVPIGIGQSSDYYRRILEQTNGVLFPGGSALFSRSNAYADAGKILYDLALEKNKNGDYYPILGICLGMELLAQVAVDGQELRAHCSPKNENLPLEFRKGFNASKLFVDAPRRLINILSTKNVTYNYHRFCVTQQNFTRFGLDKEWKILSMCKAVNGFEFISAFESKLYPFYGLQFHPEKNPFEFKSKIPHSRETVEISQYFANFFVEETRKSNHAFKDWHTEKKALIYNYAPHFTRIKDNSTYQQLYMFKECDYPCF